jgi:two-component system chemotaxis response regulator CheY
MFDLNTHVLVVDDMLTMRKLVSKILKELGFTQITEAPNGADAWNILSTGTSPIGLVISDWNMPNMTGLDLLKKVRGDAKTAKLPFVMVTAEAEKHQIMAAIEAGVTNYVIKPFSAQQLQEKLAAAHKKVSATAAAA